MTVAEESYRAPQRNHGIPINHVLLSLLFLTIIFDYRRAADSSDGGLVVILGVANLLIGFITILQLRYVHKKVLVAVAPFLVFLAFGISSGIVNGQGIYPVIAAAVPLMIFINMTVIVATICAREEEITWVLNAIIVFSMIAAVWKVFFGLSYYSADLLTVRYQVLSGATPLLFAYAATSYLVGKRRLALIAGALALGAVGISVTRSYLIVFLASGLAILLFQPRMGLRRFTTRLGIAVFVLLALLGLLAVIAPDVAGRWVIRMTASSNVGFDLTASTRIAEAQYQIDRLSSDPVGLLRGFGMVAKTEFAGHHRRLIESVLGARGTEYHGSGYGHVVYVGLFYVGGLIGGGLALFGLISVPIKGAWYLRRIGHTLSLEKRFAVMWGVSTCVGFLAYGMAGAVWGDRSVSLFCGVAYGLALTAFAGTRGRDD